MQQQQPVFHRPHDQGSFEKLPVQNDDDFLGRIGKPEEPKQISETAQVVDSFISELKRQTEGKIDPLYIDVLIKSGLGRTQSLILEDLFSKGIEVDLSNPKLCPDQSQCSIF